MRRRERALCFTAAAVPVLQLCPGLGWLPAVAGGACAALLLYICTRLLGPKGLSEAARWPAGRVASALLAAALAGLAVWSARQGEYAFPQTAGKPLPAVLLLILAWAAVRRGREVPARCAGVLLPILAALCGSVLAFSLPQTRLAWLRPTWSTPKALRACGALLLPGAVLCLPSSEERKGVPVSALAAALAAAVTAAVTAGTLSPALAQGPDAFWSLSRSVSVLGVVRRFEALVSAALLIGSFSLSALLLNAARCMLDRLAPNKANQLCELALPILLALACLPGADLLSVCGAAAMIGSVYCVLIQRAGGKNQSKKI